MNNEIVKITRAEVDALATEYFIKISCLNGAGDKDRRLLKQGLDTKGKMRDSTTLQAIISSFHDAVIKNNTVLLEGISFECNVFRRLNPSHVRAVYAFIITAGNLQQHEDAPVLDQFYADIWGTSYVDAGLTVLKQHVEKDFLESPACNANDGFTVLDYFGPGFYGMDINQTGRFFELLDGAKIGVKVTDDSIMRPIKSGTGFFVVVDDRTVLPYSDCRNCKAEYKNCYYCNVILKGRGFI